MITSGEVVRLAAPRMLELTWADDDDWDGSTRVLFQLAQAADATRLTLTHSGWEALPLPSLERVIREHASGWSRHMANLEAYVVARTLGVTVVCWGGICGLGWLETRLLSPRNTPKSSHKLGSSGTGSGPFSSFNKPPVKR